MSGFWREVFWPSNEGGDILEVARKRVVIISALVIGAMAMVNGVLTFTIKLPLFPWLAWWGVLSPPALLAIPFLQFALKKTQLVAGLLIAILLIVMTPAIAVQDGASNPASLYYAAIPVFAVFLFGARAGFLTAIGTLSIMLLLYWRAVALPESGVGLANDLTAFWNTMACFVMTISLTGCAAVFQRQMERALIQLDTSRRAAEAAYQAKSEFIANVSHEFRTPMNGILGMAQLLEDGELDDSQKELVHILRRSSDDLLDLINDVLDFSRLDAGKLTVQTAEFDPVAMIEREAARHAEAAQDKSLAFAVDIAADLHRPLVGDEARIGQIVHHLLSNAVKFTERGEIKLTARLETAPGEDGKQLSIRVSDTGCGIERDKLEALFEAFTQADASSTRAHGGAGLGLTIGRRVAEMLGGRLRASSVVGQGSVFKLQVPVGLPAGETAAPAASTPAAPPQPAEQPIRLLLADDVETNRQVASGLLEALNAEIVAVEDGQAAFDAWKKTRFDLILMDIRMPVMDGHEATQAIRRAETLDGRRRTPIFAVTGNAARDQVEDYLKAGMDGVVSKPISRGGLMACIEQARVQRRQFEPRRS